MVLSATDWPTPGCLPAYKLGSAAVFLALFLLPAIKSFQPKARIACCVVLETHFLHHEMNSFLQPLLYHPLLFRVLVVLFWKLQCQSDCLLFFLVTRYYTILEAKLQYLWFFSFLLSCIRYFSHSNPRNIYLAHDFEIWNLTVIFKLFISSLEKQVSNA